MILTGMLRIVAAPALALVAITACSKSSTTAPPALPSNKAEAPPLAPASADVLAYLAADSEIVFGFEWTTARQSAMYKTFEPQIIAGLGSKLPKIRQECGFDPMTSIERVVFGGKVTGFAIEGVMVITGVGAHTLECMAKAADGADLAKVENGVLTADRGGSDKMVATIVGGSTLVIELSREASPATLAMVLKRGAPLRTSPTFMELFGRREPNASAWGMINGSSELIAMAASNLGARPKSADGTLVLTDVFTGALRVSFANQADTDKIHQQLQQFAPMLGRYVDKIDVRADGMIVRIDVRATDAQLSTLLDKLF